MLLSSDFAISVADVSVTPYTASLALSNLPCCKPYWDSGECFQLNLLHACIRTDDNS